MPSDQEKVQELLNRGLYWEALNLSPGTASPQVILRVMELRDQFPALGVDLNRVQEVLTQQPEHYQRARSLAEQASRRLAASYGPAALDMVGPGLWREAWERISGGAPAQPAALAVEVERQVRREIESLPAIELTTVELQAGQAERVASAGVATCAQCQGSGTIRSSIARVADRARQPTLRRRLELADVPVELFSWLAQQQPDRRTDKVSIPCPACSRVVRFEFAPRARPGWVIEGRKQDASASEQVLTYARIGQIQPAQDAAQAWPPLRAELVSRHSVGIFDLFPECLLQEQFRLAQAGGKAWAETLKSAGEMVAQLSSVELTAAEVRAGTAERHVGHKDPSCSLCHGTGRASWEVALTWRPDGKLPSLDQIQRQLDLRKRFGQLDAEVPCPACLHRVIFQVPSGTAPGHVLLGQRHDSGTRLFARVESVAGIAAPPLHRAYQPTRIGGKLAAALNMLKEGVGWLLQGFGITPWWPEKALNWDAGLRGLTWILLAVLGLWSLLRIGTVWEGIRTLHPLLLVSIIPLITALFYASGPHKEEWPLVGLVLGWLFLLLLALRGPIAESLGATLKSPPPALQIKDPVSLLVMLLLLLVLFGQGLIRRKQ